MAGLSLLGANVEGRSKRANLAFEFLDTERSYVKCLETCIDAYAKPLKEANIISEAEFNKIFSNLERIAELNREYILKPLEERLESYSDETTEFCDLLEQNWNKVNALADVRLFLERKEPFLRSTQTT